jgi:hypothetical protein
LPSITLEVIQISFVVAIAIVLAELLKMLEMFKDLGHAGIGTECGFTHFVYL